MSERHMSETEVPAYCLSLPGAREDYKWGGIRVFSVAGNKMFAVLDLAGAGLSFKVADELFLGYCDRPGCGLRRIWHGRGGSAWRRPIRWGATSCVICCGARTSWWSSACPNDCRQGYCFDLSLLASSRLHL